MEISGMNITFNELRKIKDSLPDGSIHQIAETLDVSVETVRNYFGGYNYQEGQVVGVHFEPGPDGGIVHLDDTRIIEMAQKIIEEQEVEVEE
ncbi:MAG: DNA-binding protein [Chitinophagales bacterium]